jgi:predicted secreted protein
MNPLRHRLFLVLPFLLAAGAAAAETPAVRENLLNFTTTASREVVQDRLAITLQAVREGPDAAAVQSQLKQLLEAALAEARKSAEPGQLDVRTGGFTIYPRHAKDGRIAGWQGQAELVLEGRDGPRVAQAAGRLGMLNVVGVGYGLSREIAERHETEVAAEAIRKYRERAAELARQFGFANYTLGEVSVQTVDSGPGPRPMMMRAKVAEMAAADAPLPVEPGKGTITATVSGTILLTR